MEFLGHIVSDAGIEMDPKKVAAVKDWPVPVTVRDVMCYRRIAKVTNLSSAQRNIL